MTGTRSGWCWQTIKSKTTTCNSWLKTDDLDTLLVTTMVYDTMISNQQLTNSKISIKRSGIFHRLIVQFISPSRLPWWAGCKSWVKLSPFFEYDLLGSDKAASVGAKLVPPLVFNYLEALSLASNQGSQFLKLTSRSGFKLLQVQNYAGMLSTPHGFQLEILPKVGKNLTAANASNVRRAGHLHRFRHIETQQSRLFRLSVMPLARFYSPVFCMALANYLNKVYAPAYVSEQGNLALWRNKPRCFLHSCDITAGESP